MVKAFLSHSSKDKKGYVKKVADWLGKDNIIYDEYTFEEGEKPLDEILKGLDETGVFVLFLSDNALNSDWVKKEIFEARRRLEEKTIQKIFPIIIDEKIDYHDERIPDWLRENYNLKLISRAHVTAKRIDNKLRELSWSKHPELKKRHAIFVGRNDLLEKFEERLIDHDRKKPTSIIVSGFSGVGRRTFLHRGLCKTNITELTNKPIFIFLDRNDSIEDFILKLNDLGLIDLDKDISSLSDKSIQEKFSIIHKIMDTAFNNREPIYINDDSCIVNYERKVVSWFESMIKLYKNTGFPIFCIVSRYRVFIREQIKEDSFYFIEINELNTNQRKRLLTQLLEIYKIQLSPYDFTSVSDLLSGFPDQAMFAVDLIKNNKVVRFVDNLPTIASYSTDKASILLNKYQNNDQVLDFIRLLAQFEVITSKFVFAIVPENIFFPILEQLASEHIIELIGYDGEIIRLNDIVRDFIKRNRLKLNPDHELLLKEQVRESINSDNLFEMDSSEFIFTIKEALKNGHEINPQFLIPSHYLRCMKDLYYTQGNLDRIIELADIILLKETDVDIGVIQDVRYYLCLALAKKKDRRMLEEVQKIRGDEHKFLLGFYYRLNGRLREALDKFREIIDGKYVADRAKREIVQVYVQLEEYDLALGYAQKNYQENKGNQFHTQAYFSCLVNSEDPKSHARTLLELIDNLKKIDSDQSKEMAGIAEAIYLAKIEGNKISAIDKINDCIDTNPDSYYPILAKCDISIKYEDSTLLREGIQKLNTRSSQRGPSTRTINRYNAYLSAMDGNIENALTILHDDLARFPEDSKNRLIERLKAMANSGY